ncbi:hypothetical protein [Sinimarinibacterium flocculans]|uniref:hypothetical protein n=1 Tax=Sinimarinibacterium flocculans TaxID=985250 RepID=UPI003512F08C
MSDKAVSSMQFWVGTTLTFSAVLVSIWQTRAELASQRQENRLTQISVVLKDLSSAIGELAFQLESQASMYVEVQGCLTTETEPEDCWSLNSSFDPAESAKAWRDLDSQLDYSSPFLIHEKEIELLRDLRDLKASHVSAIRKLMPPREESVAEKASDTALQTRKELLRKQNELVELLSARARGHE